VVTTTLELPLELPLELLPVDCGLLGIVPLRRQKNVGLGGESHDKAHSFPSSTLHCMICVEHVWDS